jgi:hypothetical protein
MMQLLIWVMVAYGMTNILVYGSIFNGLRNGIHNWGNSETLPFNYLGKFLSSLIQCVLCTSTWVGFFLSIAYFSPNLNLVGINEFISVFFDGMLSAGFVWMINSIVEWFEENRLSNQKQEVIYNITNEDEEQVLND